MSTNHTHPAAPLRAAVATPQRPAEQARAIDADPVALELHQRVLAAREQLDRAELQLRRHLSSPQHLATRSCTICGAPMLARFRVGLQPSRLVSAAALLEYRHQCGCERGAPAGPEWRPVLEVIADVKEHA